jgi:PhnB protein
MVEASFTALFYADGTAHYESNKECTMEVNPYLEFNGQCEEAFKFYERCFGGKIEMMLRHADSPIAEQVPAEWRNSILHARLVIGDKVLLASDGPPEHYKQPQGFSVSLGINDPVEAERIFHELAEKGKVRMPFQQTFWAFRFGMVVDRYGIPWMINCEKAA